VVTIAVFLRLGLGAAGGLIVGFVLITPLERVFRRHAQPIRRAGLRTDMFHLLFTGALSSAAAVVAIVLWFIVLLPVTHGAPNPLLGLLPPVLQAVVGFLLFEAMAYVAHRAMHEVPCFWKFHAVHHSSRNLDWISGARAHPVEGFIAGAIIAPPLLLLGVRSEMLGALTVISGFWGILLHANIRWRLRWMDGWWGTPDYHHWHHSNHPEARNKNYAAFLPFIDRLCGTYWQPRDRRPQIYGIDEPMPDGWLRQMVHPLRRRPGGSPAAVGSSGPQATMAARLGPVVAPPSRSFVGALEPAWRSMTPPPNPVAGPTGEPPWRATEVDDRALVARVADGDRAALESLYRLHAGWLAVRLHGRCQDTDAVDTALQDTFLAAWTSASTFRGDGDVGAWLWGIALRRLIDQLRKRRPTPVDPASVTNGVASSAEAELFAAGIGGHVAVALTRLEPELQAVMLLTAVDGLTTKEAAIMLGIPQGTVKTRLMRARAALQEGLR
jgi:RNA polymerase sigma factor (sigma-70 family)